MVTTYRNDPESVYHTWFRNGEARLKVFRTIKNGLEDVICDIENHTFGNDFKGSSLEIVVTAISEQKQVFEGSAHAFFWKPKLRIFTPPCFRLLIQRLSTDSMPFSTKK